MSGHIHPTTATREHHTPPMTTAGRRSDDADGHGPHPRALAALAAALGIWLHAEPDALPLVELTKAVALDSAEVHKHVLLPSIGCDVAEATIAQELGDLALMEVAIIRCGRILIPVPLALS